MAVDITRDINKHNVNFAFPMGDGTQKLISEYLRLEKIEDQLMADVGHVKDDLQKLESSDIESMLTEEADPQSKKRASDIKALRERSLGIDGRIKACQVKRAELKTAILESSRTDKADWIENKLSQEWSQVQDETKKAYWEFLSAMALAAVLQIMHGTLRLDTARCEGPRFFGFLMGDDRIFYNQEVDRYLNEKGIKAERPSWGEVVHRDARPHEDRKRKLQEIQSVAQDLKHVDPDVEQILNRAREEATVAAEQGKEQS